PSLTALRYLSTRERAAARMPQRAIAAAPVSTSDRFRGLTLARFALLSAAFLAFAPLGIASAAAPIVAPTFDLDAPWEMFVVALLASLAAAAALLTYRIVQVYAPVRFGVETTAPPLSWRLVFTWQVISLPIVGTALVRSVYDLLSVHGSKWTAL